MKNAFMVLFAALVLAISAAPASASDDVVGRWVASVDTRRGPSEIVLEFTAVDEGLAGTFTARDGVEPLEDVEYADGTLTFTRKTESQGMLIALSYSANVEGETMSVVVETPRGERSFTASRAP